MLEAWLFPVERLDFLGLGAGSVNRGAAIVATAWIAVVAWACRGEAGVLRAAIRWLLSVVLTAILVQTQSRGAFLAAGAGLVVWLGTGGVRNRWRAVGLAVLLGAAAVYAGQLGAGARMVRLAEGQDASTSIRMDLYRGGLAMLADAPGGVGPGRAGLAFEQWYQEKSYGRYYLTLVNGHLTWLVERGWAGRLLWFAGWGFALWLCWPVGERGRRGGDGVAGVLAIWVVAGVAGCFSTVYDVGWFWVLPITGLLGVTAWRWRAGIWAPGRVLGGTVGAALACWGLLVVIGIGLGRDGVPIRFEAGGNRVVVGTGSPQTWVLDPDIAVLGPRYGWAIRKHVRENPDGVIGVAYGVGAEALVNDDGAVEGRRWVVSGAGPAGDLESGEAAVLWLNPSVDPASVDGAGGRWTVVLGTQGGWEARMVWSAWAEASGARITDVPGAGTFLADWEVFLDE